MKRYFFAALLCAGLCALGLSACAPATEKTGNGVSQWGALHVESGRLLNSSGEPAALRGMSSHGAVWYPRYLNGGAMATLREYGANLFRIAVYTEPDNAYIEDSERSLDYLYMGIESALAADMYVIVDWHILRDNNPRLYQREAEAFFEEISAHYGDEPGILYEICNEPNGETSWEDIRLYAEAVIPVIRRNAPGAVVLVGTPRYCTDFSGPLREPLAFDNIMYTMHRYIDISSPEDAGPGQLPKLIEAGLPVFVSEWGVAAGEQAYFAGSDMQDWDGQISLYPEAAQSFVDYMEEQHISWAGWSLSNKAEWHSALRPDCKRLSGWTEQDLTVSGKLMFENF